MFHFDRGLKLTKADLAVDFRRRQPRAFISHAHIDHMARHQYALCTPETARLYHLRMGRRDVLEMPYRRPIDWGGLRLTTYPAGHCLGSAMLLAEDGGQSLLYTGDFKLDESATAERAELPQADILVIESTYGTPEYRRSDRNEAIEQLVSLVREALASEQTPVVFAYMLGKSQEVTRILTTAGIPVVQHASIYEVSLVYQKCGVELGEFAPYQGHVPPGHARSHAAARCIARPICRGSTGRSPSRSQAGPTVPTRDIDWASIMRFRYRTTRITTSFWRPSNKSTRRWSTARTGRRVLPTACARPVTTRSGSMKPIRRRRVARPEERRAWSSDCVEGVGSLFRPATFLTTSDVTEKDS